MVKPRTNAMEETFVPGVAAESVRNDLVKGQQVVRGPGADTQAGDIVIIQVPPDGPYGVRFIADVDGYAAVVQTFEPLPNGSIGSIQRHGGVHYSDVLFEINDIPLSTVKFEEVMKLVRDRNTLKKIFKFMNSREYYRRK